MNQRTLPCGGTLMVAVFAALTPLAPASAGANPELGTFYTIDRDFGGAPGTASRGAQGPTRTDDLSGAWQAGNPELGAFYTLAAARGAQGPVRTDDPSSMAADPGRASNPELGSFYMTQR